MAQLVRLSFLAPALLVGCLTSTASLWAAEYFITDETGGTEATQVLTTTPISDASLDLALADPCQCTCSKCQAAKKPPYPGCKTCCNGCLIDWKKYPETIKPFPRPGIFSIPPTQVTAYFSLWDCLADEERPAPPKSGYATSALNAWPFFNSDWRYVESIDPEDRTFVERLKRMHINDCLLMSTGGEFWTKYHDEHNSRLTQVNNDYTLDHVRLYTDFWYSDSVRVYGEYIWADRIGGSLPPIASDIDRGDIQDLFVDLKLFDYDGKPVFVRGGRQELLYGSQRLISPPAWANKRNSFDGVKVFRQGEKWDFDAFWTQFVPAKANTLDSPDENQNFVGTWLTYRPRQGEFVDFYYLMLSNSNPVTQQGIVRSPFHVHTFGSRWNGADDDGFLWDVEGMLQTGEQNHADLFAGSATAGLGRNWKDAQWMPTAWVYYDYASGDNDPTAGGAHTLNQLFTFGHYYMGWMDLVGRQNIHDINLHLYLYPQPWVTTWLQYHHFYLADPHDALYNAGGNAYRRDQTGNAGSNVGDEVDLMFNFHVARYSDVMVSYNKLFGGRFLEQTAGPTGSSNAESLYLIFTQRW